MNDKEEKIERNQAWFEFQKPPPSEDEAQLLEVCRKLSPKQQHWAVKLIRGFLPNKP